VARQTRIAKAARQSSQKAKMHHTIHSFVLFQYDTLRITLLVLDDEHYPTATVVRHMRVDYRVLESADHNKMGLSQRWHRIPFRWKLPVAGFAVRGRYLLLLPAIFILPGNYPVIFLLFYITVVIIF
jgi:hypothetical protein